MPSSSHYQIAEIIEVMIQLKPTSILDIGMGFGKYGFLAREYLEIFDRGFNAEDTYAEFQNRIDGVEGFADYIRPFHKYIYNDIYVGDALEILPTLKHRYDLILIIDVLEHFDKEGGLRLLDAAEARGRNVLIAVPAPYVPQKAVFGNVYERHRYAWTMSDLSHLRPQVRLGGLRSLMIFWGENALEVKSRIKRNRVRLYRSVVLPMLDRARRDHLWRLATRRFPSVHALYRFLKRRIKKDKGDRSYHG